jgi:hypothetical protein
MLHLLEVSVHAHWNNKPPVYRLYVDNELLTERTFTHTPYQFFLVEHLCCNLESGVHFLTLENLDVDARFELEKLLIDNVEINKQLLKVNDNRLEWMFPIDNLLKSNNF